MTPRKLLRHIFRFRGFQESLRLAINGIAYLFLYHRNMRIIFIVGIGTFFAGIFFRLSGIELIVLCITITLVFMAEIFNTAIELMMNTVSERYHTRIRVIKDIAAGVVVLACLNALAIGCVLFAPRIFKG